MKTKHFKSRHALLMSLTSLMLCVSMLFGATFAWFTDSVTSGVNRIVSGNLDVELYHKTGSGEERITNETTDKLFQTPAFSGPTLWEPGAIAYETFTVRNEGSLALKYRFALNKLVEGHYNTVQWGDPATAAKHNLSEIIMVALANVAPTTREAAQNLSYVSWDAFVSGAAKVGNLAAKNDTDSDEESFTLVLYWKENSNEKDNLYNLKNGVYDAVTNPDGYTLNNPAGAYKNETRLWIDAGVTLNATQATSESDSFDNQYDVNADGVHSYTVAEYTTLDSASGATLTARNTANEVEATSVITQSFAQMLLDAKDDQGAAVVDENKNQVEKITSVSLQIGNSQKTTETDAELGTTTTTIATTVDLVDQDGNIVDVTKYTSDAQLSTTLKIGDGDLTNATVTVQLLNGATGAIEQTFSTTNGTLSLSYDEDTLSTNGTFTAKHYCPAVITYKSNLALDKTQINLEVNGKEQLTAKVYPSGTVTWASKNENVATVDETGLVTGVATGATKIIATANGTSVTCTVLVGSAAAGSEAVVDGQDTALTAGNFTVTVPAAAAKTSDTLTLTVVELTTEEAMAAGTFKNNIYSSNHGEKYYSLAIEGLAADGTTPLNVIYRACTGIQQGNGGVYNGKTKLNAAFNSTDGIVTVQGATSLESLSIIYRIILAEDKTLTNEFNGGTATAVLQKNSTLRGSTDEIKFTITKAEPNTKVTYDPSSQAAFAYAVNFEGVVYGKSTLTIPTGDDIPDDALDLKVYKDGIAHAQYTTFQNPYYSYNADEKVLTLTNAGIGNYTVVYTRPNNAEKSLMSSAKQMGEDKVLAVSSPVNDEMIDLVNVQDVLSVNGITITGADANLATTVKSTGAVIKANDLTFKDITVLGNSNLKFIGDGVKVKNATIKQNSGSGDTLIVNGDHADINNVNLTHAQGVSSGRYGALMLQPVTTQSNESVAKGKVYNLDHVNISVQYNGDPHTASYPTMRFMNASGIVLRAFEGVLNISNSTIDIPTNAITSPDKQWNWGWLNITDSTINSGSMNIDRVDYTKFKNVTIKNTWSGGAMFDIDAGTSYHGNLNVAFEDCTFETALNFNLGMSNENSGVYNPNITFKNCTFNNILMTEDNYQELITQYLSFSMLRSDYEGKIGTMTWSDGVLTIVPTRVAK